MGLAEVRFEPQVDDLDESTRMAIWNRIHMIVETLEDTYQGQSVIRAAFSTIWRDTLERDLRHFQHYSALNDIHQWVMIEEWHDVLSLLENLVKALDVESPGLGTTVAERLNETVLSKHLVGYRFIGLELAPISSDIDIEGVNSALVNEGAPENARSHLAKAVTLLSDRENPNYRKSMDEAITAVEAAVHAMTGKKVLSDGLKALRREGNSVHPALLQAWEKMYAWAGDDGIRHAEFRSIPKDQAMAVYVLVTCSAFVNYLASARDLTAVKG